MPSGETLKCQCKCSLGWLKKVQRMWISNSGWGGCPNTFVHKCWSSQTETIALSHSRLKFSRKVAADSIRHCPSRVSVEYSLRSIIWAPHSWHARALPPRRSGDLIVKQLLTADALVSCEKDSSLSRATIQRKGLLSAKKKKKQART